MPARVSRIAWSLAAALPLLPAAGCGNPALDRLGTRIRVGKHDVFFAAGVTREQAERAAEALIREGVFGDHPAMVQLRYQDRRYEARFPVRPGAEHLTPARERDWRATGAALSRDCFRSAPVDVHLCGEGMAALRVVPFQPLRPDLPVRVTVRPSVGGGSLVAQFHNDTDRHLTVAVALRDPTLGQARAVTLNLRPRGTTEHGWAEGWAYRSGETITVSHADYEVKELTVP